MPWIRKFLTDLGGELAAPRPSPWLKGKPPSIVAALLLSAATASVQSAGPGDLDPAFGTRGKVYTNISGAYYNSDQASAVAVQKDGKIVVVGDSFKNQHRFAVARYTSSGKLDPSFGEGGKVTTDFGQDSYDEAFAVAVQRDGRILVAGFTAADNLNGDFALARYKGDGSLDTGFGGDGRVTTDLGDNDRASSLVIQDDQKIVVAGGIDTINDNFPERFALARYHPNGTLDKTFGVNGKVVVDVSPGADGAEAVALRRDGRILAAGFAVAPSRFGTRIQFAALGLLGDGRLDPDFGTNGKVTTAFSDRGGDQAFSMAVQPDGKLVLAGYTTPDGVSLSFALARYTAKGVLDKTFSKDGLVTTAFPGASSSSGFAVAIQPDNRIILAGSSNGSDVGDFAVARYNPDGSLDARFNGDGKLTTDFDGGGDAARAIAIQRDGKILVAGAAYHDDFTHIGHGFGIVRYRSFFCDGLDATRVGTQGRDEIIGTAQSDVILGLGGDDRIEGRSGNDRICGGDGDDELFGEKGGDRIYGQAGDDLLSGGPGPDRCHGGAEQAGDTADGSCEIVLDVP